jgi:hypothetical protein
MSAAIDLMETGGQAFQARASNKFSLKVVIGTLGTFFVLFLLISSSKVKPNKPVPSQLSAEPSTRVSFKSDRWVTDLGGAMYFKGELVQIPFETVFLRIAAMGHPYATCGVSSPIEFPEISVSGSQTLKSSVGGSVTFTVATNTFNDLQTTTDCPGGWTLSDVSFSSFILSVEAENGEELVRLSCNLPASSNGLIPSDALSCVQVPPNKAEL